MVKDDIILYGVGGQGVLTITKILVNSANKAGFYYKQMEVHGMAQRGGSVYSHLRISDTLIWSPLIPKGDANLIIGLDPFQAQIYIPHISSNGYIIVNSRCCSHKKEGLDKVISQIDNLPNNIIIDADQMARDIGASKSANIAMLGLASCYLCLDDVVIQDSIKEFFHNKPKDIVLANLKLFEKSKSYQGYR